jgi:hypothetical protein
VEVAEVSLIPRHNEIRDMTQEIGKFEGKISEVEYAIIIYGSM